MTDFTVNLPRDLYRAAQVRELDRIAIEDCGIAGFKLMQTAGAAAFAALTEAWPQAQHLLVFAGAGNNGGDGYIVAGLAREHGLDVVVIQVGGVDRLSADARQALEWAQQRKVAMQRLEDYQAGEGHSHAHTVIVDALLGTGLDRAISGDYARAIELINQGQWPVLAIDVPSGLGADTGNVMGAAVAADRTISFIGMKQGLLTGQSRDYVGELLFSSLDVPEQVTRGIASPAPSARRIDINSVSHLLSPRSQASHKGDNGHVVVLGGDYGFGGAAMMAAEAAQRGGAGLVSLITRSAHRPAVLARRPEIMVLGTEDEAAPVEELIGRASVLVVGPGLGRGDWSRNLMQLALAAQRAQAIPLVVDADGLHLLAERAATGGSFKRDNWILTPHPGEAATLLTSSSAEVQQNRFAAVTQLADRWGGHILLKGSGSLIASDGSNPRIFLCSEGNAGMASGGMGDVLSGLIGGLVAQGMQLQDSLCCAVCVHGEAADLAMAAGGQRGMLATDLLPFIRQLVNPLR
jgi:ADP-dependent NAD(P)H-hydrate dehydratase / NAD(P)H-hydrate epimerase